MRHLGFVFCLFSSALFATPDSTTVKVLTVKEVPASFLKLRLSNDSIANNDRLNEELVDMVQVDEHDRKVPTLYTTHQSYGFGWFTRMIGFYWHPVDRMRYKFVGTNLNGLNMPGEKDELTEHDINFNLIPHLDPYMHFVYAVEPHNRNGFYSEEEISMQTSRNLRSFRQHWKRLMCMICIANSRHLKKCAIR
jgi:hypothetical protein